jgi:hypothetical protein
VQIIIDHTKIDTDLANFPLLLQVSSSSGLNHKDVAAIFTSLRTNTNRKKIAVTTADGITQCYVEIVEWDNANKQAWLYVKVPSISSVYDTMLYLYFDPSQFDNANFVGDIGSTPGQLVWDSNFVGVWHLTQSGNGTANEFKDSTSYAHHGTGGGGISSDTPTRTTTGGPNSPQLPYSQKMDGFNDFIQIPDSDDFSITTTNSFTMSAWINPDDINMATRDSYIAWAGKGDSWFPGNFEWQFVYYNANSSRPQRFSFYVYSPKGGYGAGDYIQSPLSQGAWTRVRVKVTCTDSTYGEEWIYRDANAYNGSADSWESYGINYVNGNAPVRLGTQYPSGGFWNGRMAEIRISNTVRSDDWEEASYYAESDGLVSFTTFDEYFLNEIDN